ncbi:MAG: phosphoribosylanthranilate isomerase [Candidatus Gastranaerophilales bacterium]|nr:phosphoribosylanthranilate isomerase [Candidatus Gastranaerophilales bacterium]
MKIKICGITLLEDALLASKLGAWTVGFIFFKNSPRYIEPEKAAEIINNLPENLEKAGVFVNSSIEEIKSIHSKTGITIIQLHGDESAEFCSELSKLNIPIIKALRINNESDLSIIPRYKDKVFAILLDKYSDKEYGGTGKSFNWDIVLKAKTYNIPLILAGGLNSSNIEEAVKLEPYAMDISSGVEKSKGIKDHQKMTELFQLI